LWQSIWSVKDVHVVDNWQRHWGKALLYGLILGIAGCGAEADTAVNAPDAPQENNIGPTAPRGCQLPIGRSTVEVEGIAVDLLMPEDRYVGDLLVLPPWNTSRDQWCMHARFCNKASKRGYRLIMPDMGKSIYAQAVYPETREDWRVEPTITWVKERLIPDLRNNYCLLKENGQNFVLGASSGARGAILLAEEMPGFFVAAAALSGDYNPAEMKGDNIYRGFLGDFESFASRWETAENVLVGSAAIRSAIYLGHGKADNVVPFSQTQTLYDLLKKQNPQVPLRLSLPADRGNDFGYWGSEVTNVLDFFESLQASGPEGALQ
jgi:S-formylglutathione hydrolase FrmB